MWNEFLPISMPITSGEVSSFCGMAAPCLRCPLPAFAAGRARARPDHSISSGAKVGIYDLISQYRSRRIKIRQGRVLLLRIAAQGNRGSYTDIAEPTRMSRVASFGAAKRWLCAWGLIWPGDSDYAVRG